MGRESTREGMARDGGGERNKGDETVPFFKLLSFADKKDVVLMVLATIGALFNGMAMPIMTKIFGELVDAFGANDRDMVVEKVSKVGALSHCSRDDVHLAFFLDSF